MSSYGLLTDAPATFTLAGVRLVDGERDTAGDLSVVDGRLAPEARADAPRIDGAGLVASPGFCDLHTHLREPGSAGETIESGARAAARGGYTTVCAMPNTEPPLDEPARVAWVQARAAGASARVRVVAAVTRGRDGERLTDLAALAEEGAVAFSDDGASVASARLARAAMAHLAELGLPLVEHAEDAQLAAGSSMRAGRIATRLGLGGWPPSAELSVVERDIALAAETGARLHLTHLSTAGALGAVRRARQRGLPVSCDVTPHHLALTDAWVAGDRRFAWQTAVELVAPEPERAYDGACRVNPPLPDHDDALALLDGVADGTIDAIATDHAPHPLQRKQVPFDEAAPGMIGLETALSLGLAAIEAGCLSLERLIAALSTRPAALIGERRSLDPGEEADLVIFDPARRRRVGDLASASWNSPLLGMELPGVVRLTVASGRVTWDDGLLASATPAGSRA